MDKVLKIFLVSLIACYRAFGQDISFSNISTSNGLSDNFIKSIEVDKNGFLWAGTSEGLNSYDGYTVTNYPLDKFPGIPAKAIIHLFCDKKNNVWMGSVEGAAFADEKRKFNRIALEDTVLNYRCAYITETEATGILLFTSKGPYIFDRSSQKWVLYKGTKFLPEFPRIREVINYDKHSVLITGDSAIWLYDYSAQKIIYTKSITNAQSVCRAGQDSIAISLDNGICQVIDIRNGKTISEYDLSKYQPHRGARSVWSEIRPAPGGNLLVASSLFGFFVIDHQGKISHFSHDPINPNSIAGDRVKRVMSTIDGTVIVGTERYGLSIFNILKKQAGYLKYFRDRNGNLFDGFLTEMVQDKDGTFWIGSFDRLIHWDKKRNVADFYKYENTAFESGIKNPEIYRVCLDKSGQVWVSILGTGPALFDRRSGTFQLVIRDSLNDPAQEDNFANDLFTDSQGKIWVSGGSGFYRIDPLTRKAESLRQDEILGPITGFRSQGFAEDKQGRIWISVYGKGIYCYDPVKKTLRQYTRKEGLIDDVCLDLMFNSQDDLYITLHKGFNVIRADGQIESYNKADGLPFDKTDALLEDDLGKIWIANAKCLIRFDPSTRKMEIFDEHDNLNNGGFKPSSSLKTAEGELLWGTQGGLNYFYPDQLSNTPEPMQVSIYNVMAGDTLLSTNTGKPVRVRYRDNNLQFYFVAVNLRGSRNIRYQFQLVGYDTKWQEGTDIRQARYSSLPPGNYVFKVRASAGRKPWVESVNSINLSIVSPVYMKWWFKIAGTLLAAGILFFIFNRRNRLLKQKKEELETEQAIHYFASSLYEHQKVDDILWDVARNCIGRLQFEDCVIYLVDEERQVLVQKAAHGPKNPRSFEITKPLDIPLGKGIVGSVAISGKAEIINDTTKDPRYIVDDEARLSEISVPIIYNGRVLGVIDCEHSKKWFFTQKHLSILSTIASLCANKIIRAQTEEEKKQAENMLAETKLKMSEAEMQALRAQMNPHFIFNCLNSINRYIVKSDQATASLYLTRFAKLIRLILDNSHSKNVVLSNEIEALRLYIEMESLRFDNKFTYEIIIDRNVQADSIEVPPLIIQPFIENAIWHGLLHKTEGGHLTVRISIAGENLLQCIIEDNGVGREKAKELKSKSATTRKSLGMELTENRLLLLNKYAEVHSSIEILDMINDQQEPAGTRVILKIPFAE